MYDKLWVNVLNCLESTVDMRVDAASALLEANTSDVWNYITSAKHMYWSSSVDWHIKSMLYTGMEIFERKRIEEIEIWFFFMAQALRHICKAIRENGFKVHLEEKSVMKFLRSIPVFVSEIPVALATGWMYKILGLAMLKNSLNEEIIGESFMVQILEQCQDGQEYIWEGIVRALNEIKILDEPHVMVLAEFAEQLVLQDSLLVYQNDFQVLIDIVIRELQDLPLVDTKRFHILGLLEAIVASEGFVRGGKYRREVLLELIETLMAESLKEDTEIDVKTQQVLHRILLEHIHVLD